MNPVVEAAPHEAALLDPTRALEPLHALHGSTILFPTRIFPARAGEAPWCRTANVLVAALGLVLLAPLMLLVALLVRLSSPGPVIYRQTRVGVDRRSRHEPGDGRRRVDYGGRLFTIYKFRTMRADPQSRLQIWAQPRDPRIFPLGRHLRRYRLDELPQLFNVLKGDMNLVGPRPEQPEIFGRLAHEVDHYAERQRVLPGITGLAQVSQPYDQSVDDVRRKLRYDLEYIHTRSLRRDLAILLRTVPVVLLQRGGW